MVGSVSNAIAIIRLLAGTPPLGVNAIARGTGISPSSAFSILKTLARENFVTFDAATKLYAIDPAPAHLFGNGQDLRGWSRLVGERLRGVAADYSATAGLWDVRGNHTVLAESFDSALPTRIQLAAGQRLPRYLGAMGRCIASLDGLSPAAVEQAIAGLRWHARPSIDAYLDEVRLAVAQGWAADRDNYLGGVTSVAAAIAAPGGQARHCVTAVSFSGQHSDEAIEAIGSRLATIAREAGRSLPRP